MTVLTPRISSKIVVRPDGCWEWTAAKMYGYGRVRLNGRTIAAHRVVYEMLVGPIPAGLEIDHLCRNRACVNPEHLEPVTKLENNRRGLRATKTHCPHGHPYSPENTVRYRNTGRLCRACIPENRKRRTERERAARAALDAA